MDMVIAMKFVQRIGSLLVKPLGRRGFLRVDLIVLLLLGLAVLASSLMHDLQPVPQTQLASAQESQTSMRTDVSLRPLTPSFRENASIAFDACGVANPLACVKFFIPKAKKQDALKIQGPLGGSDAFFFSTLPELTVGEAFVQQLEGIAQDVVDACIVLLLVLAGFRVMLGGSVFRHANVIETLPGILLALVVANLSMGIVTLFLGLNNAVSVEFYNYGVKQTPIATNVGPKPSSLKSELIKGAECVGGGLVVGGPPGAVAGGEACAIYDKLNAPADWNAVLQDQVAPPNLTSGVNLSGLGTLWDAVSNPLKFIAGVMTLMLIGQMVIRIIVLDFYIVLAPIGIGCWALPGRSGQSLTHMWLRGFFSTLFVQMLQVVALILVHLLIGAIATNIYPQFHALAPNADNTLLWVLVIAEYWFVLRIPSVLGGTPSMNMMMNFGGAMSQAVTTVITMASAEVQLGASLAMSAAGAAVTAAVVH